MPAVPFGIPPQTPQALERGIYINLTTRCVNDGELRGADGSLPRLRYYRSGLDAGQRLALRPPGISTRLEMAHESSHGRPTVANWALCEDGTHTFLDEGAPPFPQDKLVRYLAELHGVRRPPARKSMNASTLARQIRKVKARQLVTLRYLFAANPF